MKTETLKRIVKVLDGVTSDDATRFHLNCVRITDKLIEATDGFIMSKSEHGDSALAGVKEIFISREKLDYLKQVLKDVKRLETLSNYELSSHSFILNGLTISEKEGSFKYPDLNQFIPKYNNKTFSIGLNAEFLLNLAKSLQESKNPTVKLTFKPTIEVKKDGAKVITGLDSLSPIMVYVSAKDNGVIMPCRI